MPSAAPTSTEAARPNPLGRVVSGFAALAAGEIVNKAIAAVVSVYLARSLEASGFGLVGFATALATYFVLAVDLGLDFLVTREVARRPETAGAYGRRIIGIRAAAAAVVTLAYVAVALLMPRESEAKLTIALYGLLFIPYALTPKGVLLGLEQRRPWALAQVLAQSVFGGLCLLLIAGPADVWRVPVIQTAADWVQALVVIAAIWPHLAKVGVALPALGETLRQAMSFAWAQGMRILGYNFDILLIGAIFTDATAGYYLAAYKIVLLFLSFGALYSLNLLPAISRFYPEDKQLLPALVGHSLALSGGVVIPTAIGAAILAPQAVSLVYGGDYGPSVAPLRILVMTIAIIVIGGAFRNILIGCDRQRQDLALVSVSAGMNVVLNLIFTPRYGLVGAATVTVVSEIVVLIGGIWLVHRLIGPVPILQSLWPALLGTAIMAGVLLFAPLPWLLSAVVAAVAYGIVLWLTGGVRLALGRT